MKNVLIVTYYYPHRPGVGSNRIGGLCKYLPRFGWNPIVITPEFNNCRCAPYAKVIETEFTSRIDFLKSLAGLNPGVGFHQQVGNKSNGNNELQRWIIKRMKEWLAYPDEFRPWVPAAVRAGLDVVKENKIDAILSSSSPVSTHVAAYRLSRATGIPWAADLRDLWTQNHYNDYSFLRRFLEKRLELKTLGGASALITVSEAWVKELRALHNKENVFRITNGFDPDEVSTENKQSEKFTIIHAGLLYDQKRNPVLLLEAVSELIREGIIDKNKFRIDFYGPENHNLQKTIHALGISEVMKQKGVVDRETILQKQREATVQLLLKWDNPLDEPVYPAKIFEYLAARRPILSMGGKGGVIKELLESTNAGVHILDKDELKKVLVSWYELFCKEGKLPYNSKPSEVEKYSQVKMAESFARALETIANSGK